MKAFWLVLWFVAQVSAAQMEPWMHPRLKKGGITIRRAIVLPPVVSFARLGNKGVEGMQDEADALAGRIQEAIAGELVKRGVAAVPLTVSGDAAKYRVADLQNQFDELLRPVIRKPALVAEGKYTMGDRVAAFEPGRADVLVFVRGSGEVPTKGRRALGIVLVSPARPFSHFRCSVTIVDAATGDVLAFLRSWNLKNASSLATDELTPMFRDTLKPVPLPQAPQK